MIYENGKYISQNDFKMVYHIRTNFVEYHRVIACVKTHSNKQNNASKEHKKPTILNQIKIICKSKKGSKDFYTILFNQNTKDDTTYHSFWEEALGITIDKDMWKQIFRVCFKAIKDNDLIWIQCRVLYRILGTKELLFKIKSYDDGKCSFCKEYSETILYLFVQRKVVRKFWSELITYFQLILGTDLAIKLLY